MRRLTLLQVDPTAAIMTADVDREIADLARWLELDVVDASG